MFEGIPSYRPVPKTSLGVGLHGGAPSSFRVGTLGKYNEILGFGFEGGPRYPQSQKKSQC